MFAFFLSVSMHTYFRFNVRQEYEHATGLLQAFVQHKHYVTRSRR